MRTWAPSVLLAAALLWSAPTLAQNPSYKPDPKWRPPAPAAARKNPEAEKPEAKASGGKLFQGNCAICHGIDGSGIAPAADLRLRVVQAQSDGALFWKITHGNLSRGMPAFASTFSETERWQLVTYIRALGK